MKSLPTLIWCAVSSERTTVSPFSSAILLDSSRAVSLSSGAGWVGKQEEEEVADEDAQEEGEEE